MTEPERWLPIPGYEDAYEVSDLGRVRSVDRWIEAKDGRRWPMRGKLRATYLWGKGNYVTVTINHRPRTVHTLVMHAFVGPPPEGSEVRHLDGDSTNCRLSNLAYGTPLENADDMRRHGTHHNTRRVTCRHGHRLEAPNLVAARLPHRICLACARARATAQQLKKAGQDVPPHQELGDEHFRKIMLVASHL